MESKHYINQIEVNGEVKKVHFRRQLLPFILIVALLGLVVLREIKNLGLTVDELLYYQDEQSRYTSMLVDRLKFQRNRAEVELDQKIKEIAAKTAELEKITDELQAKETEVSSLQNKIQNQASQISVNSKELERLRTRPPLFSFRNESNLLDIEKKKADVRDIVTNAYDVITEVYGAPYLLHNVNITFVKNFSIAGAAGEILISNSELGLSIDIRLKDFDKTDFNDVNSVIHEIVHSFHGLAVFKTTVFEEGVTVAATDVVISKMTASGKLPQFDSLYLNISDAAYSSWNKSLTIPSDYEDFYNSPDVVKYYQMAGYAWRELYQENNNFFNEFNNRYYQRIQKGELGTDDLVKSIIKEIVNTIDSQPIDQYLSQQRAFNPV